MLHFTPKFRRAQWIAIVLFAPLFFSKSPIKAQVVDTLIMHDIGHDAATWWNSVCSWADSLNGGGGDFMQCQRWTWYSLGCGEGEQIPHIQFNLPAIPPNHTLQKVEIQLFYPTSNPFPHTTGNNQMYVQRITSNWGEASLSWVNRPSFTTVDQIPVAAASFGTQDYKVDITGIAEEWFDGTLPNYGVRLKLQNPTTYRRATFATSEHPDSNLHPRIYFTFRANPSIAVNFSDTTTCVGDTVDIQVTTQGMGSPTYSWSSIPTGFSSSQASISVNPNQDTRYIIAVSDNGQTFYDTVDVNVYDCCASDDTPYKRFHKSFSGLVDEPHGTIIGGRADLTSAGDILLANYSVGGANHEALLTKINPNGNYNWTRAYDLTAFESGLSALELSTGDYLLVGHTNSLGSGKVNLFIQKVDANGSTIIWTRIYDQTTFDVATAHATELLNGDIAIAGIASTGSGDGIALAHLDDSGFIASYEVKTFPNKGDLIVNDILATSDGGFLICGEAGAGFANDYDGALLMKYDDTATPVWAKVYRFPSSSGMYNLSSTNPAEISITRAFSIMEDVGLQKYIVAGDASDIYTFNDAMVWEVDPLSGALTAARRVIYPGLWSSFLGISQSNTNGEYLLTGYLQDPSTSTEITLLSRCDHSLAFNLHRSYGASGVSTTHRGIDIFEEVSSTDFLIHGRSIEPFMPPGSAPQAYVIRTDMNGFNGCESVQNPFYTSVVVDQFTEWENSMPFVTNLLFGAIPMHDFCGNLVDRCVPGLFIRNPDPDTRNAGLEYNFGQTSLSDEEENTTSIVIAPNPASDHIKLTLDLPDYQSVDLSIVNMSGQQVLSQKGFVATGQHNIDLSSLKAGLYIINLKSGNKVLKQQKLVLTPR